MLPTFTPLPGPRTLAGFGLRFAPELILGLVLSIVLGTLGGMGFGIGL